MKKKNLTSMMLLILILVGLSILVFPAVAKETSGKKRLIVVFKSDQDQSKQDDVIARAGGEKIKNLKLINAKVILANQAVEEKLKADGTVLRVDEDLVASALVKPVPVPLPEETPWGITKINAPVVDYPADLVRVGIIDTGISLTHPDLAANIKGGVNTISPLKSWNDDNGHGSHVAGIVAGIDNTVGVIGVAPQADLYAIKVLNSKGSGYTSDIIEGLQWAIAEKMQVVNMSLGLGVDVQSFHDAIKLVNEAGITIVAAAGNGCPNACAVIYPAAYPEVIAVSATDSANKIAYFSSRGPEVDLSAPGLSIYSTYKGTAYATLQGTSMAAPHVTGVAALVISKMGCNNVETKCNPTLIQTILEGSATNLGDDAGKDDLYGWGLVNALKAVVNVSSL